MKYAALAAVALLTACLPFGRGSERDATERPPLEQLVEPNPNISSRDLFWGSGGRANAPRTDVAYKFLERDESGASLNFDIEDPSGRKWDAKFGGDARPEVAASRLLHAIGFHQPPIYYVPEWRIEGGEEAGPQEPARFRLESWEDWKKDGEWEWQDNPFVGTRELNGLVVLMALINNWDLKTSNNLTYERPEQRSDRIYIVKDLGDSFGATPQRSFRGTQDDLEGFKSENFIEDVKDGHVELHYRPLFLNWGVDNSLTVEDVLWTCERLARLSDRQWRDAFRSAGYSDAETTEFVKHLRSKVGEGLALADRART